MSRLRETAASPGCPGRRWRVPAAIAAALVVAALVAAEAKTSWFQSCILSSIAPRLAYKVGPGQGGPLPDPRPGPYDVRLGYARLPSFLERLQWAGYRITAQARGATAVGRLASRFFFPPAREKTQAGLEILDRNGQPLLVARYPHRTYPDFKSIPAPIVRTLLFIENREILDQGHPYLNPAVEWGRLGKAVLDLGSNGLRQSGGVSGGSTLATQLEKLRHSPGGRTAGVSDKLRQMAAASLRAYLDGDRTLDARERIIRDYIDSLPLAARPGRGEISGLGDGLDAWFGADFETVNSLLDRPDGDSDPAVRRERAVAFRQVLSLLLAVRKPTAYLVRDRGALDARCDAYLRLLEDAGIISAALRDEALRAPAGYMDGPSDPGPAARAGSKAPDAVRRELISLLGARSAYDLDRLDLKVLTTIDEGAQDAVTRELRRLEEPDYAAAAGFVAPRLLGRGDPSDVVYAFTLYERTPGGNLLRVQSDSCDAPLDINEETKLELGSTAKLRTLIHYLEIVSRFHAQFAAMPREALAPSAGDVPGDRLTLWATRYLANANDRGLPAMLEAAMNRSYSADTREAFFTGGGVETFSNFERRDDGRVMTVREAFRRSVNLVFIRLMRDIVAYHVARLPGMTARLLDDPREPARQALLARFADREGRTFLARYDEKYRGQDPDRMLATLLEGVRGRSPARLAVIYRSVRPADGPERLAGYLRGLQGNAAPSGRAVETLYDKYGPDRYGLGDRGYLAGVNPLELWYVGFRTRNPHATLAQAIAESGPERQQAYEWLFKTKARKAQDRRIRVLLEDDAFREIHEAWSRLGFPFPYLVPSLATAIGSSGDNPRALAELMGIIASGGVLLPEVRIRELHFAEGTPVESVVDRRPAAGRRVLSPVIAEAVRREIRGVVEHGTGRGVAGAVVLPDGTPVPMGGKTGTGDNRYALPGRGGRERGFRVASRTATFAFVMGDRFFGTVTAYVPGPRAAGYDFTSALPLKVLRLIAPALEPLVAATTPLDSRQGRDGAPGRG